MKPLSSQVCGLNTGTTTGSTACRVLILLKQVRSEAVLRPVLSRVDAEINFERLGNEEGS